MDWTTLNSSLITAASFNEQTGELKIQFHQGRTYSYSNVDPQIALKLFEAGSPGAYFHHAIRPSYSGTEQ